MSYPIDRLPVRLAEIDRRPLTLPDADREWRRWMAEQFAPTLPKSLAEDVLYEPALDPAPRGWAWKEMAILAVLGMGSLLSLVGAVVLSIYALHVLRLIALSLRGF